MGSSGGEPIAAPSAPPGPRDLVRDDRNVIVEECIVEEVVLDVDPELAFDRSAFERLDGTADAKALSLLEAPVETSVIDHEQLSVRDLPHSVIDRIRDLAFDHDLLTEESLRVAHHLRCRRIAGIAAAAAAPGSEEKDEDDRRPQSWRRFDVTGLRRFDRSRGPRKCLQLGRSVPGSNR